MKPFSYIRSGRDDLRCCEKRKERKEIQQKLWKRGGGDAGSILRTSMRTIEQENSAEAKRAKVGAGVRIQSAGRKGLDLSWLKGKMTREGLIECIREYQEGGGDRKKKSHAIISEKESPIGKKQRPQGVGTGRAGKWEEERLQAPQKC